MYSFVYKLWRFTFPTMMLVLSMMILPMLVKSDEPLMMNFRDVDIRQIIESVGEIAGKNFLIDPRVRGKVTIIANEPIAESALYDVMLSILRMHGFRAIESLGITRVVPANLGARYSENDIPENLITEIVTINHLNAGSVIPLIKPLMTPQAQVLSHKETNTVIITEVKANLARAKTILTKLDVPSIADYDLVPLRYLDAISMQKVIQKVSNKNLRHLVEIIADEDANRIILVGPSEMRLRLRALIADMDTPAASASLSGSIRIIPLHYAKAEDMATLLKNLFSSSAFLKNLGGQGSYAFTEVTPSKPKKKAKSKKSKKSKKKQPASSKSKQALIKSGKDDARNYTVQYDEETNSLIVGGPPKIIDAVLHIISKLDVPRPQVLIEAIIADISASQMAEINSRLGNIGFDDDGNVILSNFIGGESYSGLLAGLSGGRITAGGAVTDRGHQISLLIDAVRTDTNSNVLSTPSILTLNNEEAMIDVSDTRYVETGQTSGSGSTTTARSKEEFGTLLKVTPQITEGDAVKLEIEQKTEDITGTTIDGNREFPETTKRELKTSVVVNDGDILILGGLISNQRMENESRVPLLSKVPVLGHLFRNRDSDNTANTLMIFIKPTILRNPEESHDFSKEVYARIRLEQLFYGENINSLLGDQEEMAGSAVLPKISNDADTGDEEVMEKRSKKRRKVIRRVIRRRSVEDGA